MRRALAALGLWLASAAAASAACTVSATAPSFGTYASGGGADSATGSLAVSCTVAVTVQLTASPGGSGSETARAMAASGGASLGYNLYTNAGGTTIWGDGNGGTSAISILLAIGSLNGSASFYGIIPASQSSPAGSYADTIGVTASF